MGEGNNGVNIVEAWRDPELFGSQYKDFDSWTNWQTLVKSIFGLPLTDEELSFFKEVSGRDIPPQQQVSEAWLLIGRRSGKSRTAALIATFLACFRDYSPYVAPGERVSVLCMACDKTQARVIFRYCQGLMRSVPMLAQMIASESAETIGLNNGVDLEVVPNSFRSLRGRTCAAAILDETAFWRSESSSNPDHEVLAALRPSLATIPNALILAVGSVYRKAGAQFDAYKRYFGKSDADTLVIRATAQQLNPALRQSLVDNAMEADAEAARSEWFSEFRSDLSAFLDADTVERCIEIGCLERPPRFSIRGEHITYTAFCDPSGGMHDAMTLAIGHKEGDRCVIDLVRGVPAPFSPETVVKEFAALLKAYRLHEVVGDRYSGLWCAESFQKCGVSYRYSDLSKSECYVEALARFSTGIVDLIDHKLLKNELLSLERRTGRSGRDTVDHPPGGRDDHANAVCGCVALLSTMSVLPAREVKIVGW